MPEIKIQFSKENRQEKNAHTQIFSSNFLNKTMKHGAVKILSSHFCVKGCKIFKQIHTRKQSSN
jgi:hypothetical protein